PEALPTMKQRPPPATLVSTGAGKVPSDAAPIQYWPWTYTGGIRSNVCPGAKSVSVLTTEADAVASSTRPVVGSPPSLSCQIPTRPIVPFGGPEPGPAGVPHAVWIELMTVETPVPPCFVIQRISEPGDAMPKPMASSDTPSERSSHDSGGGGGPLHASKAV